MQVHIQDCRVTYLDDLLPLRGRRLLGGVWNEPGLSLTQVCKLV